MEATSCQSALYNYVHITSSMAGNGERGTGNGERQPRYPETLMGNFHLDTTISLSMADAIDLIWH